VRISTRTRPLAPRLSIPTPAAGRLIARACAAGNAGTAPFASEARRGDNVTCLPNGIPAAADVVTVRGTASALAVWNGRNPATTTTVATKLEADARAIREVWPVIRRNLPPPQRPAPKVHLSTAARNRANAGWVSFEVSGSGAIRGEWGNALSLLAFVVSTKALVGMRSPIDSVKRVRSCS
jgi:hypothetical protein